jgi:carbon-monoxide dehydrogenase large subunit
MADSPSQERDRTPPSEPEEPYVGSEMDRTEDPELIAGRGKYIDDLDRRGMVHMAFHRSQFAHATIEDIDTSAAEAEEGVLGVYTWADLEAAGVPGKIPLVYRVPEMHEPPHRVLAKEKVRYQGKPIAVVVAEDRYTANNATKKIQVDYGRLDVVGSPKAAIEADAPTLHEEVEDNVCFNWEVGDEEATDRAFAEADHTFEFTFENQRLAPNALEPRGALAEYDSMSDELTVYMPSQNPFTHQEILSDVLDHPQRKVRVVAPNVGGGFGSKSMAYPGETLTAFASMQLERPVKWIETRTEAMQTDEHGRDQTVDAEIALSEEGDIEGLRVETFASVGGDISSKGAVGPTATFGPLVSGQYDIPAIHFYSNGIFTNATPTAPYRGVGRAESAYTIERSITLAARELGMDPTEIRRRNFIPPESFPHETAVGSVYDSGEYERAFDLALDKIDYEAFRERQAELREEGRYVGIGFASFVEPGGLAPARASDRLGMSLPESTVQTSFWESSEIRVHENGEISAYCGTASHGQGSETTHAQVVADGLGVDFDRIELTEGKDTDRGLPGTGSFGSRAAVVGGTSLTKSAEKIVNKGKQIAAHNLEVDPEDVEYADSEFHVTGVPDMSMSLAEVATKLYVGIDIPEGMEAGRLTASTYYNPEGLTWSFGTHIAIVEVDVETGEIEFENYIGVDDCGTQINPKVVEGQIQGGIAQGIGAAMYEHAVYDDNGNLITSSYQDYTFPKATHIPDMELDKTVTESPLNELGVKGVGESGTVAAPPTIVNAVTDALQPFGIDQLEMPLDAETIWSAVEEARADTD